MTFGRFETHAPADLKQLQELLAAATPGPWRSMAEDKYTVAVIGQSNNEDRWVAENVREPNAQFIIAMHEALPALLASHEALSAEVAGLRASLGAIMKLIGDGTLVRDISGDAEPGWAMKQLPLVMALKTAQELLDAARGQEKKDA